MYGHCRLQGATADSKEFINAKQRHMKSDCCQRHRNHVIHASQNVYKYNSSNSVSENKVVE